MTESLITIAVIVAIGGILIGLGRWLKGYRTTVYNSMIGTMGVLIAADYSFLPHEYAGPVFIGMAIVGQWLRQVTTSPVGEAG